ncbi:hypothetical protein STEG23_007534, partial [Scotinomys teguina]
MVAVGFLTENASVDDLCSVNLSALRHGEQNNNIVPHLSLLPMSASTSITAMDGEVLMAYCRFGAERPKLLTPPLHLPLLPCPYTGTTPLLNEHLEKTSLSS